MATYTGNLNELQDGVGSVIPITLNPGDIPSEGLVIDVSNLAPPNGHFGYILGLTVDATASNIIANILTVSFQGSNLTRTVNGGNTQIFRVPGNCLRITINKTGWTQGSINFILWNTTPPGEAGAPVVQFAAGQSVSITAGSITLTGGTVNVNQSPHNIASNTSAVGSSWAPTLVGGGTAGTIRALTVLGGNLCCYGPIAILNLSVRDITGITVYWSGTQSLNNMMQGSVQIVSLTDLGISFTNGLKFQGATGASFVDSGAFITVNVGWN